MRKPRYPTYSYVVFDNARWPYPAGTSHRAARKLRRELRAAYGDIDGPFRIVRYKIDWRWGWA